MMEYLTLSLNVPCLEFYSHQTYEKRLIPDPQFMRLIGDLDCMGEDLHLAAEGETARPICRHVNGVTLW